MRNIRTARFYRNNLAISLKLKWMTNLWNTTVFFLGNELNERQAQKTTKKRKYNKNMKEIADRSLLKCWGSAHAHMQSYPMCVCLHKWTLLQLVNITVQQRQQQQQQKHQMSKWKAPCKQQQQPLEACAFSCASVCLCVCVSEGEREWESGNVCVFAKLNSTACLVHWTYCLFNFWAIHLGLFDICDVSRQLLITWEWKRAESTRQMANEMLNANANAKCLTAQQPAPRQVRSARRP